MDVYEGIIEASCKELEQIAKAGKYRSREEVDTVYKLIDIVKDIYEIWEKADNETSDSFYSGDSYSGRGSYGRGSSYGSYGRGSSYARGRGYSMARGSGRSYGRQHGEEEFMEGLRELMEQAPDEQSRQSIQRMLGQLEQG